MTYPSRQHSTCGPRNALHKAAFLGSIRSTLALLSQGSVDINQGCEDGSTPLMLACFNGSPDVVRALLDAGAEGSLAKEDGITALFTAAQYGHLAATKILAEAGANLEAPVCDGGTSLHVAAEEGHAAVIGALVDAGAKTGSRRYDGATPLYLASREGRTDTVRVLLRARADPLLAFTNPQSGDAFVPLDSAAMFGHDGVVRELLQQVGIRGCGGVTCGLRAFFLASMSQRMGIMALLADAGVVDTAGGALLGAAEHGFEAPAKFLVKQFGATSTSGRAYVEARDAFDRTPMMLSVVACRPCSPRIVRLLIDAGADTSAAVTAAAAGMTASMPPLAFVTFRLTLPAESAKLTEQQRQTFEAIRSLLLREAAIHATSWVWPRVRAAPTTTRAAEGSVETKTPITSLGMTLPTLRRRTKSRRRALLWTMFRHSSKNPERIHQTRKAT